jgi:UDP-N-acetylmuramyl tripeptide synthase
VVAELVSVDQVPITFGGRATYNIENALGAAALASALGIADEAIVVGLKSFQTNAEDNPGRGNLATLPSGVSVLVDFGHNPAGIERVLAFARVLAGEAPICVISGMPGDRPDAEIQDVARQIAHARPKRVFLRELEGYLRGREVGAIPAILRAALMEAGVSAEAIAVAGSEAEALSMALEGSSAGELIAILPSIEGEAVHALLEARSAQWT